MADFYPGMKPEPLIISRLFKAPRARVFAAWSSAEHIKRWFSPAGCSVPEAEVDFRPGGAIAVCMLLPDGTRNWSRGNFIEIFAPERLAFAGSVSAGDKPLFNVHTTVTFADEGDGTKLTVQQAYEIFDESAQFAIGGATEGWRTTLDKLEVLLIRLSTPAAFGSFTLERIFSALPARVFQALTNMEAKEKWFTGGEGYTVLERRMEARPGGREILEGRWADGTISKFDAVYFDVIADTRLVYAYEMHLNGEKISVSLATVELRPAGEGTKFTITEQGSFLNGYADNGSREQGTGLLLDQIGRSLDGLPLAGLKPRETSAQSASDGAKS